MSNETKAAVAAIERVYTDVVGPMREKFIEKSEYFVAILTSTVDTP